MFLFHLSYILFVFMKVSKFSALLKLLFGRNQHGRVWGCVYKGLGVFGSSCQNVTEMRLSQGIEQLLCRPQMKLSNIYYLF